MNDKTRRWLTYSGLVVLGIILGLGLYWVAVGSSGPSAESQASGGDLESQVESLSAQVASLESQLAEAQASLKAVGDPDDDSTSDVDSSGRPSDSGDSSDSSSSSGDVDEQFCYITRAVWEGAQPEITVDYADLLFGAEAHDAAIAAGEEPFDFYIRNVNPRLRTFGADTSMSVKVVSRTDSVEPSGYDMGFGEWFDAYSGMSPDIPRLRDAGYYIWVRDGKIVQLEEVYFP